MEPRSDFNLYIAYNASDFELVTRFSHDLQEWGITATFHYNDRNESKDTIDQSGSGIQQSDGVLFLITSNSLSPDYLENMAKSFAIIAKASDFILPVILGDIPIPTFIQNFQGIKSPAYSGVLINDIVNAVENFKEKKKWNESNTRLSNESTSNKPKSRNYWLLKMNPNTWIINNLNEGVNTFFNTYYFGSKRPEFDLFKEIQVGDFVLGYLTGEYQGIVCTMEVHEPVGPNTKQGEGFEMTITKKLNPVISRLRINTIIPDILSKPTLNENPPQLFFPLTETAYNSILSIQDQPLPPYENNFQPFILTEGNHEQTQDQLDFENDINSFASVITLKKVNPPLAIGLFGNWGSGKSFFMEKLSEKIKQYANSKENEYVSDVVQVKFNSWHYSDTNLWASLISQIFESLHDYALLKQYGPTTIQAIFSKLDITNQQLEEIQNQIESNNVEQKSLEKQKVNVDAIIKEKKEALNIWKTKDIVEIVLSDPAIKQDFEKIKAQVVKENLIENIDEINDKIAELDTTQNRIRKSLTLLKENHKGKWFWIWVMGIVISVGLALLLGPFNGLIQEIKYEGFMITGAIVGWFVKIVNDLSPYLDKINIFYKRIKSLKKTIELEKEKIRLKEHDEVDRLNKEIEILSSEMIALTAKEKKVMEQKVQLQNELKDIGSGKLLAKFLETKSSDEGYMKQLGIISWIRKDFKKLDDLFKKQKSALETERELPIEVQIDRIVLYIDDLDRCNEDVVVKVLEAIHLLLAFPLFVVIVGVDPRWLNNALSKKYKNLFGYDIGKKTKKTSQLGVENETAPESLGALSGEASSYDYLEKIFQIPFALKPINKTGREKLIQYLIKDEMVVDPPIGNVTQSPSKFDIINTETVHTEVATGLQTNQGTTNIPEDQKMQNLKKAKERLVFTNEELVYMQKISSLFGQTPRTINRYVNIYRIIKAHGNLKVTGDFSKEEFMPILFVLGVIIGYSQYAREIIDAIIKSENAYTFNDFLSTVNIDEKVKASITTLAVDIENQKMENIKMNVELISRFSFRTLLNNSGEVTLAL